MNYFKIHLSVVLISFLCITNGCAKEKLTKATEKGANTFSCLIDGKVFKPCDTPGSLGFGGPSLSGGASISRVGIGARCNSSAANRKDISVYIENFNGIGEYPLSNRDNHCIYEYNYMNYDSKNTGVGKIVITKDDRINKIVSGRFEFKGSPDSNSADVIKVTDGRFDIKY